MIGWAPGAWTNHTPVATPAKPEHMRRPVDLVKRRIPRPGHRTDSHEDRETTTRGRTTVTPDDVARYRRWADTSWYIAPADCDPRELCDALEAARAERAAALGAWHGMGDAWADLQAWADHESDRADRAEEAISNERQKVVNLTGELSVVNDHLADVIDRAERAEASLVIADGVQRTMKVALEQANAALARVRALCDSEVWDTTLLASEVRAAIEGP